MADLDYPFAFGKPFWIERQPFPSHDWRVWHVRFLPFVLLLCIALVPAELLLVCDLHEILVDVVLPTIATVAHSQTFWTKIFPITIIIVGDDTSDHCVVETRIAIATMTSVVARHANIELAVAAANVAMDILAKHDNIIAVLTGVELLTAAEQGSIFDAILQSNYVP